VAKNRRRHVNATGRNEGEIERVVILRRSLLHSPQFSAAGPATRALILELHAMFNGTNNGTIFLSVRDAAARLGFSCYRATMRAFDEALALGWIAETIGSHFDIKADAVSRARAWQLNWIDKRSGRCVGPDALKPLDFAKLTPQQRRRANARQETLKRYLKDYAERRFAVEETSTLGARMALAEPCTVEETSTLKSGNGENLPISSVEESSGIHKYHGGAGARWISQFNP
jgi:hypothetical protein